MKFSDIIKQGLKARAVQKENYDDYLKSFCFYLLQSCQHFFFLSLFLRGVQTAEVRGKTIHAGKTGMRERDETGHRTGNYVKNVAFGQSINFKQNNSDYLIRMAPFGIFFIILPRHKFNHRNFKN